MAGEFHTQGYEIVRGLLPPVEADLLKTYMLRRCQLGDGLLVDRQVPGGVSVHGDPLFDALLFQHVPTLSAVSGRELLPTYSYARVYLTGAALAPHKDRPACEISATISVAVEPSEPWPIHVGEGDGSQVLLQPGDALFYKGCEVRHWRDPFAGRACVQVFLHYVDRDGPYAEHAFDALEVEGRLRDYPTWEAAEDRHVRLTVYRELLAEQAAAKEQA